jgi:hypothetical protein
MGDARAAREIGTAARVCALEQYGLGRFLSDWDSVLEEAAA